MWEVLRPHVSSSGIRDQDLLQLATSLVGAIGGASVGAISERDGWGHRRSRSGDRSCFSATIVGTISDRELRLPFPVPPQLSPSSFLIVRQLIPQDSATLRR